MHIDFVKQPDIDSVPSELSRHAYRIVQEGLTNARKHAPGQSVHLALSGAKNEGLLIEITNSTGMESTETGVPGAGVGLVGLRERVEFAGGTVDTDADEAGRHRLRARLPWPV